MRSATVEVSDAHDAESTMKKRRNVKTSDDKKHSCSSSMWTSGIGYKGVVYQRHQCRSSWINFSGKVTTDVKETLDVLRFTFPKHSKREAVLTVAIFTRRQLGKVKMFESLFKR